MGKARQWPPLLSADGKEIKVGDLLYQAEVFVSDYREERHRAKVQVLRVTDIDLARRYARARCSKGCERKIEFEKSCTTIPYFLSAMRVTTDLRRQVSEGVQNLETEIAEKTRILRAARGLEKRIKFDPEPAPA